MVPQVVFRRGLESSRKKDVSSESFVIREVGSEVIVKDGGKSGY